MRAATAMAPPSVGGPVPRPRRRRRRRQRRRRQRRVSRRARGGARRGGGAERARLGSVFEETKTTTLRCGGTLREGCAASRARASVPRPRDAPSRTHTSRPTLALARGPDPGGADVRRAARADAGRRAVAPMLLRAFWPPQTARARRGETRGDAKRRRSRVRHRPRRRWARSGEHVARAVPPGGRERDARGERGARPAWTHLRPVGGGQAVDAAGVVRAAHGRRAHLHAHGRGGGGGVARVARHRRRLQRGGQAPLLAGQRVQLPAVRSRRLRVRDVGESARVRRRVPRTRGRTWTACPRCAASAAGRSTAC
jgi:hypothetical protein